MLLCYIAKSARSCSSRVNKRLLRRLFSLIVATIELRVLIRLLIIKPLPDGLYVALIVIVVRRYGIAFNALLIDALVAYNASLGIDFIGFSAVT